jgi:hypothetical protein
MISALAIQGTPSLKPCHSARDLPQSLLGRTALRLTRSEKRGGSYVMTATVRTFELFMLGRTTWTHILTHQGLWDPTDAIACCVWTAFATLAGLGIIRPLKMLPILLLEIFYKVLWLIIVAYPLWSNGKLEGSPAEDITSPFLWVILPIVAVPWGYVFVNYIYKPEK